MLVMDITLKYTDFTTELLNFDNYLLEFISCYTIYLWYTNKLMTFFSVKQLELRMGSQMISS